jgi:hypothetical protein
MLISIDAGLYEGATKMSEEHPLDFNAGMAHRRVRVIVALELLLHRDAISRAISLLRPDWEITELPPEELADVLANSVPDAVIASNLVEPAASTISVWVTLGSEGSADCVLIINGEQNEIGSPSLMSLLGFIEQGHNSAKLLS